jgi:opacity protein-like surface antigen
MKKVPVILLVAMALLMAGIAEAAPKKKRTRNANRVGPYAGAMVNMSSYTTEQDIDDQGVIDFFAQQGIPFSNVSETSDDSNMGYEAVFGYRFNRYIGAELGLMKAGEMKSKLNGDFGPPGSTVPGYLSIDYSFSGPVFSVIGILPLHDKFEFYGRAGLLFAGADRNIKVRIGDDVTNLGGNRGDSSDLIYGGGMQYHINVMFTVRAEYMMFRDIGDPQTTGVEDLNNIGLGLIVRF